MSDLPDIPLTDEAAQLLRHLQPRILQRLEAVRRVPVSVLLWGPGISSPSRLAIVRGNLRKRLREDGHAAVYGEEICDTTSGHSLRMQQLAQALEFDLVVSLPCTPGSIGEIHDFAADRRVSSKILMFLDRQSMAGYSPQSLALMETVVSCQVEYYSGEEATDVIEAVTLSNVQRIREMKYVLAGRA